MSDADPRLAGVRDAIAVKVANCPSAVHVYGNGTNPDVAPYPPETIDLQPHGLVGRGPTKASGGTGNQRLAVVTYVLWRAALIDRAAAEQFLDAIEDELIAEFASGITLGGLVIDCGYDGADEPFEYTDESGREWLAMRTRIVALIRYSYEMTP